VAAVRGDRRCGDGIRVTRTHVPQVALVPMCEGMWLLRRLLLGEDVVHGRLGRGHLQ
jgi:hypothetical protein